MAGRVITIAQRKGGAGKTTLAAQLAVAWAKRGAQRRAARYRPAGKPRRLGRVATGAARGRGDRLSSSRRCPAGAPSNGSPIAPERLTRRRRRPGAYRDRGAHRGARRRAGADPGPTLAARSVGDGGNLGDGARRAASRGRRVEPGAAAVDRNRAHRRRSCESRSGARGQPHQAIASRWFTRWLKGLGVHETAAASPAAAEIAALARELRDR